MAYSTEQKKKLLAVSLPETTQVREIVRDYMARCGLTLEQFSARIGYAKSTLNNFLGGSYQRVAASDAAIRQSVLTYVQANPIAANEFTPGKLYETSNVRLMRKCFAEVLEKSRCGILEGDPGTQKSWVAQHLIYELNQRELSKNGHGRRAYYVYCPEEIRPKALVRLMAEAAGSIANGEVRAIFKNLKHHLHGRRSAFLFDESQHLSKQCMETVRELHDLPPHCGMLFLGSHNFGHKLTVNALEMEQWNSRLHFRKSLPGMDEDEAERCITGELGAGANKKVIETLLRRSRMDHLRSGGKQQYISARRLFDALRDLSEEPRAEGADA